MPVAAQLVSLAVVVAISPAKIIPALLVVIHADRPRHSSIAFLVASLVALAAVTALFAAQSATIVALAKEAGATTLAVYEVVLGVLLVLIGAFVWRRRAAERLMPQRMSRVGRITPASAGLLGTVLTVGNPKVMVANMAAGTVIGVAATSAWSAATAVGFYTLLGGSTLIVPIVGYLFAAEKVDERLKAARQWIARRIGRRTPAISAFLLVVFGLLLVTGGATST